jgi:hypothetical protein
MNLDEITIDQEFIELAKAEMAKEPRLRPCKMCFHYETCVKTKGVKSYNYGAACFVTNEQMLRALLLQEKKRAREQQAKLWEKLDVMQIMIGGADMIREDILDMLEMEYKRLQIKAETDDATYAKNKRNLERLRMCYAQMKASMAKIESEYRRFIEYWNAQMFADEKGHYNAEYDKHNHNIGFCTYLFYCIYDKMYMNNSNVEAFAKVLNGLPGRDVLSESDIKRYLIKI